MRVDPNKAHHLMISEGYCFLDVRTDLEFVQGHPRDAYNIPWRFRDSEGMHANPAFVKEVLANFARTTKLILGCASGARSRAAVERLRAEGFTQLADQYAGWSGIRDPFGRIQVPGWRDSGLPVSYDPEVGRSYAELTREQG